jgi:RNA polymerase sigma-70 factor (ECF subfamily)
MDISEVKAQLEAHHGPGYGWALSCCRRDPVEAEEVLQTVYVKVLEGKARFDGRASFRTWFFAVIRKTAADRRRRSWIHALRTLQFAERMGWEDGSRREPHPEEAVRRLETNETFRRALAALPRRQNEALQLVFYHDLSVEEAAAVMGVSVGSARTHYDRGKKRLRELLEGTEAMYATGWRTRENPGEVS